MNVQQVFAGLAVAGRQRHALHLPERDWPQTNCYVDLWIEVLYAAQLPPEAALGFTVAQDFEGDHFTFFKYPPEDLESLHGVRVQELAIFDTLEAHVLGQIARGHLSLVEVDGFHLPDTVGVSYRLEHTKTTIAINRLDVEGRGMDYFHNDGFFALSGDNFDGIFGRLPAQKAQADRLFPYVEFAKFPPAGSAVSLSGEALRKAAAANLQRHMARAPKANPVRAWQTAIGSDARDLAQRPSAAFHKYAFNTARQMGANFELLASHLDWLTAQGETGFEAARRGAAALSSAAKSLQFQLARAVTRKKFDGLEALLEPMAGHYDDTMRALRARPAG